MKIHLCHTPTAPQLLLLNTMKVAPNKCWDFWAPFLMWLLLLFTHIPVWSVLLLCLEKSFKASLKSMWAFTPNLWMKGQGIWNTWLRLWPPPYTITKIQENPHQMLKVRSLGSQACRFVSITFIFPLYHFLYSVLTHQITDSERRKWWLSIIVRDRELYLIQT